MPYQLKGQGSAGAVLRSNPQAAEVVENRLGMPLGNIGEGGIETIPGPAVGEVDKVTARGQGVWFAA